MTVLKLKLDEIKVKAKMPGSSTLASYGTKSLFLPTK